MNIRLRTCVFALGVIGGALALAGAGAGGAQRRRNDDSRPSTRPRVVEQDVPVYVSKKDELLQALQDSYHGRIIVRAGSVIDLSGEKDLELSSGDRLIGEPGPLGRRPLIFTNTKAFKRGTKIPVEAGGYTVTMPGRIIDPPLDPFHLFFIRANDVRVEGIHFRGSEGGNRDNFQPYVHAIQVIQTPPGSDHPEAATGRNIVISDCEFDQWTGSGVTVINSLSFVEGYFDEGNTLPHLHIEDAGQVRVERSYFHENARLDGGYGVDISGGAYATVEFNVFDFNRHAVAAGGLSGGYVARFNYVLQGGYAYPPNGYYGQHFDVHGTGPGYNGGRAGESFKIELNTIRGAQKYGGAFGVAKKIRPAFELRGLPKIGASFTNNVVVHSSPLDAIRLKGLFTGSRNPYDVYRLKQSGNHYDTDYSREVATGDFDGDGITDVFVANGTAWFYSRGGVRPWEFLHASTKRLRDLALADIDDDGITDVLYRDPSGNLGYLKSGVRDLVNFTTSPVPAKDLRFGDFDGDGKIDMFCTLNHQWQVWYGRTRAWTKTQSSIQPISELLFGEFDSVRGTDVVGVTPGEWSYSSGATGFWTRLNNKLIPSFAGAVAADFNGDGKCDIAWNEGGKWMWSPDGRSPKLVLRDAAFTAGYPRLKEQLVGQFDRGTEAEVVIFEYKRLVGLSLPSNRLVIWPGLHGPTSAYRALSEQDMR